MRLGEGLIGGLCFLFVIGLTVYVTEAVVMHRVAAKAPPPPLGVRCGEPQHGWNLLVSRTANGELSCVYFQPFTPPIEGEKNGSVSR
jgi:hypothetical protein